MAQLTYDMGIPKEGEQRGEKGAKLEDRKQVRANKDASEGRFVRFVRFCQICRFVRFVKFVRFDYFRI